MSCWSIKRIWIPLAHDALKFSSLDQITRMMFSNIGWIWICRAHDSAINGSSLARLMRMTHLCFTVIWIRKSAQCTEVWALIHFGGERHPLFLYSFQFLRSRWQSPNHTSDWLCCFQSLEGCEAVLEMRQSSFGRRCVWLLPFQIIWRLRKQGRGLSIKKVAKKIIHVSALNS